ncbi:MULTISPECIES: helix-turn-helix domain-containing protein [unclassified Mesorhizobium]|uniref:helix-turn-helix domain-containing protein n=1 Tax=unclassified Mesorhizobium TaxID=325217 RepID=UPI00142EC70B|nr:MULTISPECIES: helix-turn-helix domain-containing protein [unclassified Mesorhizobium]
MTVVLTDAELDLVALLARRRDDREAYSIKEVAEMFGLSQRTVLRRIADGSLAVVRSGGRTLVLKHPPQNKVA